MQLACMPFLAQGRYLLGFSGGADSLALFSLLLESHIAFDIAIVDYGMRPESAEEVRSAHALASSHHKHCFSVKSPTFASNFEANARNFRYEFFSTLIATHGYDGLILAHHLNDRIEWLLLRLGKGSGLAGLLGFDEIGWYYPAHSAPYPIIRPLLWVQKDELLAYCEENGLRFFTDSSNADTTHERNFIRHHFASAFIKHYHKGVRESLKLLSIECDELYQGGFRILSACHESPSSSFPRSATFPVPPKQPPTLARGYGVEPPDPPPESKAPESKVLDSGVKLICVSAFGKLQAIHHIASALKTCGYVLSRKQREEIARAHYSFELRTSTHAFYIAPYPAALQARESSSSKSTPPESTPAESSSLDSSTPSLRILIIAQSVSTGVHSPALHHAPCHAPYQTSHPNPHLDSRQAPSASPISQPMPKSIKELCRKRTIPKRLRPILYAISMRELALAAREGASIEPSLCAMEHVLWRIEQGFLTLDSHASR